MRLDLAPTGTLAPVWAAGSGLVRLVEPGGATVLTYGGLEAYDSNGRRLPASLSVEGAAPRLLVDDTAAVYPLTIDPWVQQQKLTTFDAAAGDLFGISVSVSGDTALIGAHRDDDAGSDTGSAYVFARTGTTGSQQEKLVANDAAMGDQFGISVSLSGDTALVGADRDDDTATDSGSAYVFIRTGVNWVQQAKLTAGDPAEVDQFGVSVSLSGDTAVIGAPVNDAGIVDSGAAHVFVRSGSTRNQQAKFIASDPAVNDLFGWSVSLSGDTATDSGSVYVFLRTGVTWAQQAKLTAGETALIGAAFDDEVGNSSGSAYVFLRTGVTWAQQAKLTAGDAGANDFFGWSVSLSGETALIGAAFDDEVGNSSGSAYVFLRTGVTWAQQAKLTAGDAGANDFFGWSVSLSGETALIGAAFDDEVGNSSGSAYVFLRTGVTWAQQAKLTAGDAGANDFFGWSVSLSGETALIGTAFDDDAASDSGAAYVFVRSGATWTQQQKLTADSAAKGDLFGISASVSGETALVGAYFDDTIASDAGSAYVSVFATPTPTPTPSPATATPTPSPPNRDPHTDARPTYARSWADPASHGSPAARDHPRSRKWRRLPGGAPRHCRAGDAAGHRDQGGGGHLRLPVLPPVSCRPCAYRAGPRPTRSRRGRRAHVRGDGLRPHGSGA